MSKGTMGYFKRNPHIKYIAPAMIVMVLLSIVPTLFLMAVSFTNYQLGWDFGRARFSGLDNYLRLLTGVDRDFWHSVLISLAFMLLATGTALDN
jgi:multiple sugar transport system permease protein